MLGSQADVLFKRPTNPVTLGKSYALPLQDYIPSICHSTYASWQTTRWDPCSQQCRRLEVWVQGTLLVLFLFYVNLSGLHL